MAHRVVIVGGGFGGLSAAKALARSDAAVTLVDRRNFHLFQPLLYQVATGSLSPANIASPLRGILRRRRTVEVLLGEVVAIDPRGKRVILADGELPYDTLILAAGARHHYFGHGQFEAMAPGLKTIEDATAIRARVMTSFEAAERHTDPRELASYMTFVVVGGGPTGVELAGALGELAHRTLRRDFRRIDTTTTQILLLEARDRVLPTYPPKLSRKAEASLARLGVTVRTQTMLEEIADDRVTIRSGDKCETIEARNVLWAAGVQAAPLAGMVAAVTDAKTDSAGRLMVEPDCTLPGYRDIYCIGDMTHYAHPGDKPLPGIAPVAMQQAKFVAETILRKLKGQPPRTFHYTDRGQMATIGPAAAVVDMGRIQFGGFAAWMTWLLLHLLMLVGFENRLLVFVQWCWNYLTRSRSARLITHTDAVLFDRAGDKDGSSESATSTSGFAMK